MQIDRACALYRERLRRSVAPAWPIGVRCTNNFYVAYVADRAKDARGPYLTALARGDDLPDAERAAIAEQLSRYTGLSPAFLIRNNLRVDLGRFRKELLRDQNRTVGRLDPAVRKNIHFAYFESGHMIYIRPEALAPLKAELDRFWAESARSSD